MYLRTLKGRKAARSANFFWEEIFMPKSQLGGILYIFPPGCLPKVFLGLHNPLNEVGVILAKMPSLNWAPSLPSFMPSFDGRCPVKLGKSAKWYL